MKKDRTPVRYYCTLCPKEWLAPRWGSWESLHHCPDCDRHSVRVQAVK
jgi:hypothetical protein